MSCSKCYSSLYSDIFDKSENGLNGVISCHLGKGGVIEDSVVVTAVAYRTDDTEGNLVYVANVADRAALHLTAHSAEILDDRILLLFSRDELIAGAYSALKHMDIGSGLLYRLYRRGSQRFIRRE